MKKYEQLIFDDEIFSRIKNNERTICVLNENNELKKNQKVIVVNKKNNKILKKKIIKIYHNDNIQQLKDNLKKKSKYIYQLASEDNKITAIEFKYNKRIFTKLFLLIVILIAIFFSFNCIKHTINSLRTKKIHNQIEEVNLNKTSYVIVEINPKIILELKNNIVINTSCLNEDCINIFDSINIVNNNIKDAIIKLYETAIINGIDTSNGVKISSKDNNIGNELKGLDYVKYNKINSKQEVDYINQILDNNIKQQVLNQNYENKLLEIYKKDPDYDKYYYCIIDDELECYLTEEFTQNFSYLLSKNGSEEEILKKIISKTLEFDPILQRILEKFKVEYKTETYFGITGITDIKMNDTFYELMTSISTANGSIGAGFNIADVEDGILVLKLQNFNLFNSNYKQEHLLQLSTLPPEI